MEDSEIVDLYLARDESAIRETEQKYGYRLRRMAHSILDNEESAKECENDTYLQAWNLIPPHEPRQGMLAFLGRICRHLAIDAYRRSHTQKRSAVMVELTKEMEDYLPAGGRDEEWDKLQEKELVKKINLFLENCPKWKRVIFVRRYWHLEDIAEIAKHYGYTQGKVRIELFRMREKLREYLKAEGYEI